MRTLCFLLLVFLSLGRLGLGQRPSTWRVATPEQLEAVLPSRAPVEKERIETEMRTATGIVNERGKIIAAVVLITAGYAADGKYSHYLLVQSPITIGDRQLVPGSYVVGWKHAEDGLSVHVFDAGTGAERATALARPLPAPHRVESFRIFPPADHAGIQIGRYMLPYTLTP
ncbi:MAG: hypothetical protein INR62_06535 [Rhodospirillales bacterium]|nr:hypothetical protein [Acetobacter sp.]